ncbi:MAG: response regulator [Treponema sp.]|nr:response regulator [Treponema sp.]
MKKILLLGHENNTTTEIKSFLSQCFSVSEEFGDAKIVDGMIRISIPDLIFINLVGGHNDFRDIFYLLANSYATIPVVVFGSQITCRPYSGFFSTGQFSQINCTIIDNTVIRASCRALGLNYNDIMNAARNKFNGEEKSCILLVDDSALQHRISKNILEPKYAVKIAMSAKQATEAIQERVPDLIILDYDMPEMDGYKFLKILRENAATATIPVIFLTGIVDKEHIAKVVPLKPDGYLLKPVVAEKLLARVGELLSR